MLTFSQYPLVLLVAHHIWFSLYGKQLTSFQYLYESLLKNPSLHVHYYNIHMLASYQQPLTVHPFVDEVVDTFLQFALYYQNDENGVPLSVTTTIDDLPETLYAAVYAEIVEFTTKVREATKRDFDPAQLGVDFYFARNCSLTGFWDKSDIYGEYTQLLQDLSQQYQPFRIDYV